MKFYSQLYIGESVRNYRRIMRRLKRGSLFTNAYVLTFAAENDLLEIYDAKIFAQKYYRNFPRMIVGLAADYEEAVELVIKIVEECLSARGDCDVKTYLRDTMQKERHD